MSITKKFLLKLSILIVFIIFSDLFFGHILQALYFKAKYNEIYTTNQIVNKIDDDVLIFGSSRASHHYVPSILSDSLKMSVFNCGRDKQCIYYYYGLFMKVTERYLPKLIILDIFPSDYNRSIYSIDGMKELAPYYGSNKELDSLIYLINPLEKYKMISMLYRYNSRIVDILGDIFIKIDRNWENGYIPFFDQMNPVNLIEPVNKSKPIIEPEKLVYLEKFISFCKQNNIPIFICISPIYSSGNCDYSEDFLPLENIAEKYHVPIFNHTCNPLFSKNNSLFKDGLHLNHEGATLYSSIIGQEIKTYLENNHSPGKN